MKHAYIENGTVKEVARVDPSSIFQPGYAALFAPCPDEVEPGWVFSGDTFAAPIVPPVAASEVITAIKAERDRRKFNGVFVSGKWLHTNTYSRTQWMGMVMMGASIPAIEWTTMDGTSITTSQALAGAVFQGTAQLDATLFGYARALITQVEAAADPASVDIVSGWPATFEPIP